MKFQNNEASKNYRRGGTILSWAVEDFISEERYSLWTSFLGGAIGLLILLRHPFCLAPSHLVVSAEAESFMAICVYDSGAG